jgi:hypothetical protein
MDILGDIPPLDGTSDLMMQTPMLFLEQRHGMDTGSMRVQMEKQPD